MANNNMGLVLGGIAKGATDTYTTMQSEHRANTVEADAHAQQVQLQQAQGEAAALQPTPAGTVVGSTTGDAQPVEKWATDQGIDPAPYRGLSASDLSTMYPFASVPKGARASSLYTGPDAYSQDRG